jgi:hypothetical protein
MALFDNGLVLPWGQATGVRDDQAAALIALFYGELQKQQPPAVDLKAAQALAVLRTLRDVLAAV